MRTKKASVKELVSTPPTTPPTLILTPVTADDAVGPENKRTAIPLSNVTSIQIPVEATCLSTPQNNQSMDIDSSFTSEPSPLPLPLPPALERGSPSPPPTPTRGSKTPDAPSQNRLLAFLDSVMAPPGPPTPTPPPGRTQHCQPRLLPPSAQPAHPNEWLSQ